MDESYTKNSIAAVNPLFGVVNYIVLSLPGGWRVRGEKLPPTVDKIIRRREVKWVSAGRIVSIYYSSQIGGTIDIEVFDGNKVRRHVGDVIYINGHTAEVRSYRVKRGIIKRRWVEVLDISFYCDVTDRSFRIRMFGLGLIDNRDLVLRALAESICH